MTATKHLVEFVLDEHRFALALDAVERVVRAVEVTPLPKAPAAILGVIKVQDRVVPVFNVRRKFGCPERGIEPDDQLIIARGPLGLVALPVDAVRGLIECGEDAIVSAETFFRGTHAVEGVAKTADGMVLIHAADKFLSTEETSQLREAMGAEI